MASRTKLDRLLVEKLGGDDGFGAMQRACNALLSEAGTAKLPTRLSTLARHLGAGIRYEDDGGLSSEEAATRIVDGNLQLWVSRSKFESARSRSRARFSIAHEIGHLILFRLMGPEFLDHSESDSQSYAMTERLCDFAASHLLMPRSSLSQAMKGRGFTSTGMSGLAELFDVSRTALLKAVADLVPGGAVIEIRKFRRKPSELLTWRVWNTYTSSAENSFESWLPNGCTMRHIVGAEFPKLHLDQPQALEGITLVRGSSRVMRDAVICLWPLSEDAQMDFLPGGQSQIGATRLVQDITQGRRMLLVGQPKRLDFSQFGVLSPDENIRLGSPKGITRSDGG